MPKRRIVTELISELLGYGSFPRGQVPIHRDDFAVWTQPRRCPLSQGVGPPAIPQAAHGAGVNSSLGGEQESQTTDKHVLNCPWTKSAEEYTQNYVIYSELLSINGNLHFDN